jgi:hypothetical protein
VEFTPDIAYTLTEWRVYKTSDVPDKWVENPKAIEEISVIQELGPPPVTIPDPNASGWSKADKAIEIKNDSDFSTIASSGQYVLANSNITVSNPIPTLTGKLFGNGHTVNISGDCAGLFGTVNGGLVRDLTVHCNNVNLTSAPAYFGGIADLTSGAAQLINVSVTGTATLSGSGATVYAGGLVGRMEGTSSISNAYSILDLKVHTSVTGSLYVGGFVGQGYVMNDCYALGDVFVDDSYSC